jgi:hypothetical protein
LFGHVPVLLLVPFSVGLALGSLLTLSRYTLTSFPQHCPTNYFDGCYALKM